MSYVYFMCTALRDGIAISSLTDQIEETRSRLADLDGEYMTLTSRITLELAHGKGFQTTDVAVYIDRSREQGPLSLRHDHDEHP